MIKTLIETDNFLLQMDTYDIGLGIEFQTKSGYGSYGIKIRFLVFTICVALL